MHINKKKLIVLSLALVLAMSMLPLFAAYANRQVVVYIDGQRVDFTDQQPIIVRSRALVPVREVFEHIGFEVEWSSCVRMARITKCDIVIIIPTDVDVFTVNDEIIIPDVPQQIINGRIMLPIRAVAEAVGATTQWSNISGVARIYIDSPLKVEAFLY